MLSASGLTQAVNSVISIQITMFHTIVLRQVVKIELFLYGKYKTKYKTNIDIDF